MKALAYLPHGLDIPAELIASLDAMKDARPLAKNVAIGRVSGTRRWLALYDDGEGFFAFGKQGAAPTLAEIIQAVREIAKQEVVQ